VNEALTLVLATGAVVVCLAVALVRVRTQLEVVRALARAKDAELERLSRVATGAAVAQQLVTPLAVIAGRAEQLVARTRGDERAHKAAQAILDQTEHIHRVVRELLGDARAD
jgi:two-component system, NtrC family, sensor kinase